jgi:hypothetical protein
MVNPSLMTKRLDATWVAGTGNGGLDAGTLANNTWYYAFIIKNPTSGAVDFLFSTSRTSPTLPTGFTKYRRIAGAVLTDGSASILPFTRVSPTDYIFNTVIESAEATISAATSVTVQAPPSMVALLRIVSRTAAALFVVQPLNETSALANATALPGASVGNSTSASELEVKVNSSSQLRVAPDAASRAYSLYTKGFRDVLVLDGG